MNLTTKPSTRTPGDHFPRLPRSRENLQWLAGFMEGEATFGFSKGRPRIRTVSTDLDVLERAAAIGGVGHVFPLPDRLTQSGTPAKPAWSWEVSRQADAAGLMMTLHPLLGSRRRARIEEVLLSWRSR